MEQLGTATTWSEAAEIAQKEINSGRVSWAATISLEEYKQRRWAAFPSTMLQEALSSGILEKMYPAQRLHIFRNSTMINDQQRWSVVIVYLKEGEEIE